MFAVAAFASAASAASPGFKLAGAGSCVGTGAWIQSRGSCEVAAKGLGLPDTTAQVPLGGADCPYACYYKPSNAAAQA